MGVSCNKILPITSGWQPRILTKSCIDWGLWSNFDLPAEEAQLREGIHLECTVSVSSIIWPCKVISFLHRFHILTLVFILIWVTRYKVPIWHFLTPSFWLIPVNSPVLYLHLCTTPSLHFNLLVSLCILSPLFYLHLLKNTLFPPDVLFLVPGFQGYSKLRKLC